MRITIDEGSTAGMDAIKRARFDPTFGDDVDLYGEVVALRTEAVVRIPQYWFEVCDFTLKYYLKIETTLTHTLCVRVK